MENRMQDLRQERGLTQTAVAEAIGITQRKYSYVETGEQQVTGDLLIKLALFYGTNTDYLLGLTDEEKPYPRSILLED